MCLAFRKVAFVLILYCTPSHMWPRQPIWLAVHIQNENIVFVQNKKNKDYLMSLFKRVATYPRWIISLSSVPSLNSYVSQYLCFHSVLVAIKPSLIQYDLALAPPLHSALVSVPVGVLFDIYPLRPPPFPKDLLCTPLLPCLALW